MQNALAAPAAARVLGAGEDAIRRELAAAVVQGRVEPVAVDAPFTVLIDYAHNEAAAESLLRTLRAYTPARLVAVFGCGGERSRLRRFGMGSVCARLADFCVITEDNSRSEPVEHILADIRAGLKLGNPATPLPRYRTGGRPFYALAHAQPGDIVAILGKGHETTIERNGVKEPFVESEIVEEYWDSKGRSCAEGKAAKRIKSSLCRSRHPRRPAGDADTPFTGACRATSPLPAAEGSRPLPANLPQKGLQRQSYGPGMPGPYRSKTPLAPSQNGAGVLPIL